MIHPNRELIQRAYDAFGRGDIPTVLGILDETIRWHVPGQSPLSGNYVGHEQVLSFFQKSIELSQGTLRIEVHDIVASDAKVFVLCTVSATVRANALNSRKSTFGALQTVARLSFASFRRRIHREQVLEIAGGRNSESARAFKSEQVSVGLFKNLLRLPVQILDKQTPEPNTPERL